MLSTQDGADITAALKAHTGVGLGGLRSGGHRFWVQQGLPAAAILQQGGWAPTSNVPSLYYWGRSGVGYSLLRDAMLGNRRPSQDSGRSEASSRTGGTTQWGGTQRTGSLSSTPPVRHRTAKERRGLPSPASTNGQHRSVAPLGGEGGQDARVNDVGWTP